MVVQTVGILYLSVMFMLFGGLYFYWARALLAKTKMLESKISSERATITRLETSKRAMSAKFLRKV